MCLRFSLKQRGLALLGIFKTVVLISLVDLHYSHSGLLLMRQYIPYSFNGHKSLLQISSTLKRESLVDSFPINTILIYMLLFNMSKIVRTQLYIDAQQTCSSYVSSHHSVFSARISQTGKTTHSKCCVCLQCSFYTRKTTSIVQQALCTILPL